MVSSTTHTASSTERAALHAIFGVGHTFSNVREAFRTISDRTRSNPSRSVAANRRRSRIWATSLDRREKVSELLLLGLQVSRGGRCRRDFDRKPLTYRQSVARQARELPWIVAEQTRRLHPEMAQHAERGAIIPAVRGEAEPLVRLNSIDALVLQGVGANLVRQPDAAPFLIEIEEYAAPVLDDLIHRRVQLRAAIAAGGMEEVARQAGRVHAREHVLSVADVPADERHMRFCGENALEYVNIELTVICRKLCRSDAPYLWQAKQRSNG